jgi:ATP/ADP translocase
MQDKTTWKTYSFPISDVFLILSLFFCSFPLLFFLCLYFIDSFLHPTPSSAPYSNDKQDSSPKVMNQRGMQGDEISTEC